MLYRWANNIIVFGKLFVSNSTYMIGFIVATTCPCTRAIERSSHASHRLIRVLTSLANTHAGQSERCLPPAPIRTPELSSRLSGQRWILFTQPRGTPEQERQLVISFRRLYFPWYIFPPHLSAFGHRAILIWGDRDMAGRCSRTNRIPTDS